jgi:hypothetical protein
VWVGVLVVAWVVFGWRVLVGVVPHRCRGAVGGRVDAEIGERTGFSGVVCGGTGRCGCVARRCIAGESGRRLREGAVCERTVCWWISGNLTVGERRARGTLVLCKLTWRKLTWRKLTRRRLIGRGFTGRRVGWGRGGLGLSE